ncbi:MAG: hypothetical protein ACQESF_00840 [Nanobdellota archaeon]
MVLFDEVKNKVKSKFGVYSAAKIDDFSKEIDPNTDPKGFLDKCVDFLSTLMGEERAREELKDLFQKYC